MPNYVLVTKSIRGGRVTDTIDTLHSWQHVMPNYRGRDSNTPRKYNGAMANQACAQSTSHQHPASTDLLPRNHRPQKRRVHQSSHDWRRGCVYMRRKRDIELRCRYSRHVCWYRLRDGKDANFRNSHVKYSRIKQLTKTELNDKLPVEVLWSLSLCFVIMSARTSR